MKNITVGHFGINGLFKMATFRYVNVIRTSYFGKANILTKSLPYTEILMLILSKTEF